MALDIEQFFAFLPLHEVRVLELSRLIRAKEFAGRPKDLAVLPVLRATLDEIRKRSGSP